MRGSFFIYQENMQETLESPITSKPIEYGSGITVKELPHKILITAQCRTRLKQGNFLLEAEVIYVEAGPGVKISSKGKDTLVIAADLTKLEEAIFDLQKNTDERLAVIEKVFAQIIKNAKK